MRGRRFARPDAPDRQRKEARSLSLLAHVLWLDMQAVTLGTGRLSTTRQLEIQVDSVFQLDEDERSGGREGVGGGEKGSGSITRHELRRVLVNNEPFDPSTLWSLLPPAGVGGGRSLDSIGATGVGGAASAAAGMPLLLFASQLRPGHLSMSTCF